jgi:hypothetical protein
MTLANVITPLTLKEIEVLLSPVDLKFHLSQARGDGLMGDGEEKTGNEDPGLGQF